MLHFEERKQADYFARSPFAGRFQVDLGGGTKGSHFALVGFDAPLLWKDWRFAARAGATKAARFGYFGLGNDTKFIEDSVDDDTSPFFYRMKRNRYFGSAEISRHIHVLRVGLAGQLLLIERKPLAPQVWQHGARSPTSRFLRRPRP